MRRRVGYLVSLGIQLALAPFLIHSWDGFVFLRSVQDFLHGVTPYAVGAASPWWTHTGPAYPAPNQWYAYPPLPLLVMTLFAAPLAVLHAPDWAWRVAIKLPMILGTLALAWIVRAWVVELGGSEEAANRAELLVLLNPFFLLLSGAWGMFDALFAALLLAALLLGARGQLLSGGLLLGASAATKVFPGLFVPFLAVLAWRRWGTKAALQGLGASAASFALVSLPFFLAQPRGFLEEVLLVHLGRPPQGYALVSALTLPDVVNLYAGTSLPLAPSSWLGIATTAGLLALVGASAWLAFGVRTKRGVLALTLGAFLAFLLVSKVVNDQYLTLPIALLAILAALAGASYARGFALFTWGGTVALLLSGWHFVTFLPPDVALAVFGPEGSAKLWGVDPASYDPFWAQLPNAIAILALVPAFVWTLRHLVRETPAPLRRAGLRVGVPLLVVLLVAGALVDAQAAPTGPAPSLGTVHRGVVYDMDFLNPAQDPSIRFGTWLETPDAPQAGFPTAGGDYYAVDFAAIRDAGFDFVLINTTPRSLPFVPGIVKAAEANHLPFAIVYDPAAPHLNLESLRYAARSGDWLSYDGGSLLLPVRHDLGDACQPGTPPLVWAAHASSANASACGTDALLVIRAGPAGDNLPNAGELKGAARWIVVDAWNGFTHATWIQPSQGHPEGGLARARNATS